jgi:hypothetical protein
MAKDKNEIGDDDLDNWDDMGFGDDDFADFDAPPPKDDRKPVVKVATSFLKGAAEELTDPSRVRKMALDALPDGYGKATNLADTIASTGRELYHTTAEELKPVIKDAKRVARRVLPLTKSLLPEKLQKKLEDMTTDNDYKGPSVDQTRDAQINSEVADIFKLQMENDARDKAEGELADATKTKQESARFKTELQTLNAILGGINRQVAYQDQIASKYQRKHLELQFLQYFTLRDTYELHKASSKESKQQLDIIAKNTGLPEYVKSNMGEQASHLFRERLLNAASSKVNQFAKGYIDKYKDNIIKAGKENIGAFKDAAMNGIMSGDALLDAQESMADVGEQSDKYKTAGGFLGGQAGGWLGGKLSKFAKPLLEKHPGIGKMGNKLEYGVDNFASLASDWAKSDKGENTGLDWWNKALRGFKNLSPTEVSDSGLGDTDLTKSQDAVPFNHLARKTLTDIIPGYLSRIHHELAIIRTGDPSIQRLGYDLKDGSFANMDKVTKSMGSVMFKQTENFDKVKDTTNGLIDGLETKHGKKFSDVQRKALYDKFIGEAASGQGRFDVKKFSDVDQWKDLSDDDALQLSYMFSDDVGEDQQNKYSKEFLKIREGVNNPTDAIKGLIDSGQLESMRALGLVTGEGDDRKVSQERIVDILRNGGFGEPTADRNPPNGHPPGNLNNRPGGGGPLGDLRNASDAPKAAGANPGGLDTPKNPNDFMETIGEYQMLLLEDIRKGIANPQALAQYADAARSDPKASEEECTCVDKMIDAYKAGNDELAQHLANVYELLASGQLQTMSMNMPFDAEAMKGFKGSIGRGLGKIKNAGKWGFGKVGGFYKGAMDLQGKLIKGGFKGAWAGVKGTGKMLFGKGKEKLNEWGDVYIKGTGRPILTWAQLKAGEYLNEDGSPITSWKDVKGPVKNKAGEYVLTADQFARGLVDEHARPMFTKIKDFGMKWFGRLNNMITSPFRGIKDAVKGTFNTVKNFVERPRDMYLPGNPIPVLLASIMKAGGYKNSDGSIIKKMTDIKGTVYDLEGNVVISLESLKAGLVDVAGKKFKSLGAAAWDGAKKLIGGAFSLGKKAFNFGKNTMAKTLGGLKKGAGNLFNKGKGMLKGMKVPGMGGSSEMMEVIGEYQILLLEEIRDAIRDQSPKRVKGDFDGDGVRNGAGEMLSAGRKKNREEREAKQKAREEERNKGKGEKKGGLLGLLGMIAGGVMGMAKNLLSLPKALMTMAKSLSVLKGLSNLIPGGKTLGKLGRGAMAVGRGVMGAGGMLGRAAMGVGRLALGGTGTLLRGAWAVGSMAVGVLGAPVVLGIAAAAAIGYLGFKAWKAYKKSKNSDLLKYRVAQYGLDYDDNDQTSKVFELESIIGPNIKFNSKAPTIDWKNVDVKRVREIFGIKEDDPEAIQRFGKWFETRFGPIFVSHMKMLQKFSKATKIEEADEAVDVKDKLKFLEGVQVDDADATYGEMTSPFGEDALSMGPAEVKRVYDEVVAHIKESMPENKDAKGPKESLLSKVGSMAANFTPMGLAAKGLMALSDKLGLGDKAKAVGGWLSEHADSIAKVMPVFGLAIKAVGWLKDKIMGKEFKVPSILNRDIDPLTSIRYRLYGLLTMEYVRASPISRLEELVIKDISYNGAKKAEWDGDTDAVWKELGSSFTNNPDSEDVKSRWMKWFSDRFLPVLISYLTAVQKFLSNGNPFEAYDRIKASQSYEIARFINGTTSNEEKDGPSVWTASPSPFDDYQLNTDSSVVKPFMDALQEAANKETLNEKVKTGQAAKVQALVDKVTGGSGANGPPSPLYKDRGVAERSGAPKALLKAMYGVLPMAGGEAGYTTGGLGTLDVGAGSGGTIAGLPEVTGPDGEYSTYKDMIIAVSKMVGVDPGLMATMASIESGFRGRVKASTSSATGLYQFISGTWKTMIAKYGAKYGLDPNTPPSDPRANALMGAEYIRENSEILKAKTGRAPSDTDIYLAHFLGPGGAAKLLKADPQANAATLMPQAASANKSIFFADGRPRTVAQVYAEIDRRVKVHRSKYAGDARSAGGFSADVSTATPAQNIPGITPMGGSSAAPGASAPAAPTGAGTTGIMAPASTPVPGAPSGETPPAAPSVEAPANSLSPMAKTVGVMMPTPSASAPTTVAPVTSNVPAGGVGSGEPALGGVVAEAAVIRKAQAERQAQATSLQDQESSAQLNQNFSGVADTMRKQLETQLKMAQSLDNIDQGIQKLVQGGATSAGQEPATKEPQSSRTNTAAKPTDVPVRMTPISMKRIQSK